MDLRNNQITLGELWDDTRAREVFKRRFPMIAKHPVQGAGRTVTLQQLSDFMASWLPGPVINGVVSDLKKL